MTAPTDGRPGERLDVGHIGARPFQPRTDAAGHLRLIDARIDALGLDEARQDIDEKRLREEVILPERGKVCGVVSLRAQRDALSSGRKPGSRRGYVSVPLSVEGS